VKGHADEGSISAECHYLVYQHRGTSFVGATSSHVDEGGISAICRNGFLIEDYGSKTIPDLSTQ